MTRLSVDSTVHTCHLTWTRKRASSDSGADIYFLGGSVLLSGRWRRPSPAPWSGRNARLESPTAKRSPPTRGARVRVKTRGRCARDTSSASSAKFASAAERKGPCDGNQVGLFESDSQTYCSCRLDSTRLGLTGVWGSEWFSSSQTVDWVLVSLLAC